MKFLRQLALLATTACMGLVLTACESRVATAPTQAALSSTVVTPATVNLGIRGTQALSVMGHFSDGTTADFTSGSTYASSNAAVATVNSAGLVTGAGAGTATITTTYLYSYGGATQTATGTAAVTVTGAPLVSIAVSPVASMPTGTTQTLIVTGTYADATTGPITTGLSYVSSDPTVATVSNAGVVTAVRAGTSTITVTEVASQKAATAAITVAALSYTVVDFGSTAYGNTPFGGAATVVKTTGIPTGGATGSVLQFTKTAGAACYAGDTMWVGGLDSIGRLPFSATATTITMQVYVPVAGVVIKLKAEDANNPGVSVETDVTPTTTGWQTLSFDFSHQSPGTAALVIANTYNKLSVFGDFTCVNGNPPPAADEVFFIGPIKFIGATGPSAPPLALPAVSYAVVDYSSASYGNTPFGGGTALVKSTGIPAGGPAGPVLQFTKTAGAACYAGDTMWVGGLDSIGRLPFSATATTITMQAYVPVAGVVIKLKVEDANNPGVSVETDVTPTATGWQTLSFDFSHQSPGTAALVLANTYNKISVFGDFTCVNGNPAPAADEVFYFGAALFIGATGPSAPPLASATTSYAVVDYSSASYGNTPFGGGTALVKSTGIPSGGPAGPVLQFTKTAGAACYAGDTMWVGSLDSIGRLPFSATATTITIQAYVPVAGVVIKLKVEDANNTGVSVETDVTPTATGWQTLSFDFSHQSPGTAALSLASTYNKISVFGDFTCVNGNPAPAADEVFYFGAALFIGASGPSAPPLGGTPTLSSIAITPSPVNLAPAATQQLTVTGTYSNNTTQDTTAGSGFGSNATGVATVSSGGLVTAVAVGTATITATDTASGKTATVTVNVATGGGGGGNGIVFASGALDAGVGFVPFGGSTNVPAPAVDATTLYTDGTAALKVVVTGAAGSYSGGAWVASSPRDLRSFNALTFWAKGSQAQSTLKVQLGNDAGAGANVDFQVESIGIPLTTNWRQYAIPLPDPAKANGIDGLISFADANNNYTFWLANVQYQNLPASVLGTGFVAGDGFNGVQLSGNPASLSIPVGSNYGINPGPNSIVWTLGTAAFNGSTFVPLPNGGNLNNDAWRWFTLTSSNPGVATVSPDGLISAVAAGTTTISGTMAGTAIPGVVPVTVTAPLARPSINAPTPGFAAGNVIALFDSNSLYAHNAIDNLNENWCGAGASEAPYQIPGGNQVLNYVLPNCTGIGFESHTINLTSAGMTHFHIDIWTPNPVSTILQLVDAAGGGVGSFTPTLVANSWNSIDVPISSFSGLSATTAIQQIGFINGGQFTVLYIDNMYFHN